MSALRRRSVGSLTLATLMVLGANAANAQESEVLSLTLEQALDLASGSNPALRQATNSVALNGSEMRTTWLDQLLPRASLTLFQTGFTGNLQRQALDNFGNPIVKPGADWNFFSRTTHNLGLRWDFQGASLLQVHRRQRLVNEDRSLAQLRALTDVQIQVQRLYVDALEQRALMRAEDDLIDSRTIDLDVAERLFSLALKTRVDVLNAELAIEQQTLAFHRQAAAYQRALLSLRTAIGLTDPRPIEIEDEELPVFDPVGFDATALVSRAMESNPALRQSEVAISSAVLGVAEQRREWWPRVSLGIDVYRQDFQSGSSGLFDTNISQDLESQFFINFSIPVLNGLFQQKVDQQRASIEVSNQRERDRQDRLELEAVIRGAVLDLENEWTSFRLSERSNVIAEETLRLAREEYRLGTRSFEDLRSSFQQEADTRRQVIMARHAFVDALLALEEAVGVSVRETIRASTGSVGS